MKKLLILFLAAAVAATVLFSCSDSGTKDATGSDKTFADRD